MTTPKKATPFVPLRTYTPGTTSGNYVLNWTPVRTEGSDHEQVPSRYADRRVWRDGRFELTKEEA